MADILPFPDVRCGQKHFLSHAYEFCLPAGNSCCLKLRKTFCYSGTTDALGGSSEEKQCWPFFLWTRENQWWTVRCSEVGTSLPKTNRRS